MRTASTGGSVRRTASPNGSRPRLPTVQRPKVNLCSGLGVYLSSAIVRSHFLLCISLSLLPSERARHNSPITIQWPRGQGPDRSVDSSGNARALTDGLRLGFNQRADALRLGTRPDLALHKK